MGQLPGIAVFTLAVASCSGADQLTVRTVSEYGGTPIAGVNVQAGDQAWTLTDEAGEAVFEPIDGPFTVMAHQIMLAPSGNQYEDVFVLPEQTGSAIVVEVDGSLVTERQASISGTLTGRVASDSRVLISVSGGDPGLAGGGQAEGDVFGAGVSWEVGTTRMATVHALEVDGADPPTTYFSYGSADVDVTDGGSLTGVVVSLSPIGQGRVTGEMGLPEQIAALPLEWYVAVEPAGLYIGQWSDQPATLDLMLPQVPGNRVLVGALAIDRQNQDGIRSTRSRYLDPPASAVAFDLPTPLALTGPAESAVLDSSTQFRWNPGPAGGEDLLHVVCELMTTDLRVVNYRPFPAEGDTASLPEIPSLALDSGMTCTWEVIWHEQNDDEWRSSYSGQRALTVP